MMGSPVAEPKHGTVGNSATNCRIPRPGPARRGTVDTKHPHPPTKDGQVNEQPDLSSVLASVRTEPIQQRSAQRIALLLDAAAEIIDENGIDGLTTSDVATRSGSSIGVVYRYFPNIQSLLRALASSFMSEYTDRVFSALEGKSDAWRTAFDAAVDIFVDMARTRPGFRALRFGDVIADRFLSPDLSNNAVLATSIAGALGEKYDFAPDDTFVFELEIVIEIEDALLKRAFQLDPNGDPRFIQKAREIGQGYLRDHTSLPSGS
jgi:AcrR family transcriptional regulator